MISPKWLIGNISSPSTICASFSFCFGRTILFIPILLVSIQIGRIPFIFSTLPYKDSSPTKIVSFKNSAKYGLLICLLAIKIPKAIGKSNFEPSFFVFAGAKFTIIFLLNISPCVFFIAVLTLSFASFTLASGNPNYLEMRKPC